MHYIENVKELKNRKSKIIFMNGAFVNAQCIIS